MVQTVESRTGLEDDVTQLLKQFLAGIAAGVEVHEIREADIACEVILFEILLDGVQYKLTCQPCPDCRPPPHRLSPREQEIIRLVMRGFSTRGIAEVLEISPWTVTTHLRRVFSKLSVNSRAEMVACVMREGILEERGSASP